MLGMVEWYSWFISRESEVFVWAEKQQEAFQALKTILIEALVFVRPDFSQTFKVPCLPAGYQTIMTSY